MIRERTAAELPAARARGRKGARPRVMTEQKAKLARELYDGRECTVQEIAHTLTVSRATIYRSLAPTGSGGAAVSRHP